MCLIVLVPLEPGVNSVEESRFSRPELVFPTVGSGIVQAFLEVEEFFVLVQIPRGFVLVEPFRSKICQRGSRNIFDKVCRSLTSGQEVRRADESTSSELYAEVIGKREGWKGISCACTDQCSEFVLLVNDRQIPILRRQCSGIKQLGTHFPRVFFDLFLLFDRFSFCLGDFRSVGYSCRVGDSAAQLFLNLHCLVALFLTKLFKSILNDDKVDLVQLALFDMNRQ